MNKTKELISLVLKAAALGLAVASVVLGFLPEAGSTQTQVGLIGLGLACLALDAIQGREPKRGYQP